MDSIEEVPIFDLNPTYLDDEAFDQLYPKHPIDVSFHPHTITPLLQQLRV